MRTSDLGIDAEPLGKGRWRVALSGRCDRRAGRALLDEARGLALVGAQQVSVDLSHLDHLDAGGLGAIADFDRALAACGAEVEVAADPTAPVLDAEPSERPTEA